MEGQRAGLCRLGHYGPTRDAGRKAKCPPTHGCWAGPGRAGKEPCTPRPGLQFLSRSLPPSCLLHSRQLGTLSRPILSQRMACCGWVWSPPHCPLRTRGQGFQQRNSQKPSLFILYSCRSTSLHKLRMSGFWRGRRSVRTQTLPEIVYAHCRGWLDLRSNLTVNSTESEMYKSVKAAAGWFLASPRGSELHPSVLCKGPGAGLGAQPDSSPGEEQSCSSSRSVSRDRYMGVCPGAHAPSGSVAFEPVSASCLYVRPLKVFMQV